MPYEHELESVPNLQAVRRRVGRWQNARVGRARIPEALRLDVVQIASQVGVYRAAADLGLTYSSVKRWSEAAGTQISAPCSAEVGPSFVELLAPALAGCGVECVLHVESPGGLRLKLELKGMSPQALAALVRDLVA